MSPGKLVNFGWTTHTGETIVSTPIRTGMIVSNIEYREDISTEYLDQDEDECWYVSEEIFDTYVVNVLWNDGSLETQPLANLFEVV